MLGTPGPGSRLIVLAVPGNGFVLRVAIALRVLSRSPGHSSRTAILEPARAHPASPLYGSSLGLQQVPESMADSSRSGGVGYESVLKLPTPQAASAVPQAASAVPGAAGGNAEQTQFRKGSRAGVQEPGP